LLKLTITILTDIFPGEPGSAGFIEAKDDGSGGDNWSYKSCKDPVKSSTPTNQHPAFFFTGRMPFLSPNQQCRAQKEYTNILNTQSVCTIYLCFNGQFPCEPGLVTRMSPFCILLELRMMDVEVTTGAVRHAKLQSKCYHQ